jgi:CRISPR-associated endonuclease/helicase Cas3
MTHHLTWDDFPAFYRDLHLALDLGARQPHPWQLALVENVRSGSWPDNVHTPTGSGKSVFGLSHVFGCAVDPDYPSRLLYVVPRRVLVSQLYTEVERAVALLRSNENLSPVLSAVRERLLARRLATRVPFDAAGPEPDPVILAMRMGAMGSRMPSAWLTDPLACTVLVMTMPMAMSTLLFHGYGTTAAARAQEAGMLTHDTVMVLDEAHTMRQALHTARRVAELVGRERAAEDLGAKPLQVVAATATPDDAMDNDGQTTITLDDADRANPSSAIGKVLYADKPLTVLDVKEITPKLLAKRAHELHHTVGHGNSPGNSSVGVVVNTVIQAAGVAAELTGAGLTVAVLTGRMRLYDRDRLTTDEFPELLTPDGNKDVDVLVATQVIEIGVDVDLSGMVTALAAGDALAQRAGRVNRRGTHKLPAPVVVVAAVDGKGGPAAQGPYTADELAAAYAWLHELSGDISPLAVDNHRPPVRSLLRSALERLEPEDAMCWSLHTSRTKFQTPELRLWTDDDLVSYRPEVSVVLRSAPDGNPLLSDPGQRAAFLDALPPDPVEMWKGPANVVTGDTRGSRGLIGKHFVMGGVVKAVSYIPRGTDAGDAVDYGGEDLCNEDTLVLWTAQGDGIPMLTQLVPDEDGTGIAYPVPVDKLRKRPHGKNAGTVTVLYGDEVPVAEDRHRAQAAEAGYPETYPDAALWFAAREAAGNRHGFVALAPRTYSELAGSGDGDGDYDSPRSWAVVLPWKASPDDAALMSTVSTSDTPVVLDTHQSDVADVAGLVATGVGLDTALAGDQVTAALHHDDGKGEPRFQAYLGDGTLYSPVIAKSAADDQTRQRRRDKRRFGLPPGWRHEQLSAAIVYARYASTPARDLVTALTGLSHGYGRGGFDHGMATLLGEENIAAAVAGQTDDGVPLYEVSLCTNGSTAKVVAADIFTEGVWHKLLADVNRRYGPWGLAWLESLLRAADTHTSARGH